MNSSSIGGRREFIESVANELRPLLANYLAPYVVLLLWFPAVNMIVRMEERELRQRCGEEHVQYCREVPRFLPRCKCTPRR
ncbi:MAG: methyltransferase family protein [Gammaproteobacteria bacterium]